MTTQLDEIDRSLTEMMRTVAQAHPTPPRFDEIMREPARAMFTSAGRRPLRVIGLAVAAVLVLGMLVVGFNHRASAPLRPVGSSSASGFAELEAAVGCVDRPAGGTFADVTLPGLGTICTLGTGQLVSIEFFAGVADVRAIIAAQSALLCQPDLTSVHGSNWIAWVMGDPAALQALVPLGATPVPCAS